MPRIVFWSLTYLGLLSWPLINFATAQDTAATARQVWAAYTAAQLEWQRGLAQLVIDNRPEFQTVALAQRDLQLELIALRSVQFEYLLGNEPSRIVLSEGLANFVNFGWTDDDTRILRQVDPGYAAIEGRVAEFRTANDAQPRWPAFREYFRNTLAGTEAYQALYGKFMRQQKAAEGLLPGSAD